MPFPVSVTEKDVTDWQIGRLVCQSEWYWVRLAGLDYKKPENQPDPGYEGICPAEKAKAETA